MILTIDVEEWFNASSIQQYIGINPESRITTQITYLLKILESSNSTATFFVLGSIAEKYPELIRKISKNHEIATHGYSHKTFADSNEFEKDLRKSVNTLKKITKNSIIGYRAPNFLIKCDSAMEILSENGIKYDSSLFWLKNNKVSSSSRIIELPVTIGGAYTRLLPLFITKLLISKNTLFYVHPWEIDSDLPLVDCPLHTKIRNYYGIKKMRRFIEYIVKKTKTTSIKEFYGL